MPSLDRASLPLSAFEWLCDTCSGFSGKGAALVQIENRKWLKLDNYVGVIESPCGTQIEILPKVHEQSNNVEEARELLLRMIAIAAELPVRQASQATLRSRNAPLSEWVMAEFLGQLDQLIRQGLRFDYSWVEEERRHLRGQLNIAKQIRQPPGRTAYFNIRHEVYEPDRPENRLLHSAVETICRRTRVPGTWKIANELRQMMRSVPHSSDISSDFKRWSVDRLMAHYRSIKPWCELVLSEHQPFAVSGEVRGLSLLFPMEVVFERCVIASLRRTLPPGVNLQVKAKNQHLCVHEGKPMFRLEPDILLHTSSHSLVLDAKWKKKSSDVGAHYGISREDAFQMHAYGEKYLTGQAVGDVVLVFPRTAQFPTAPSDFVINDRIRMRAIPFDLGKQVLIDATFWTRFWATR